MNFQFINTKNGEKTVKTDNLYLHSLYNPNQEAKRFVDSINFPFRVKNLVIIEPVLSYIVPFLRERFPDIKIFAIRIKKEFLGNGNFDKEFIYKNNQNAVNEILNYVGEADLLKTFFINWTPSTKAFPDEMQEIWKQIKEITEKAKTILITSEFFEKKWLTNSIKNLCNINKIVRLPLINKPVLICASGPSLKSALKIIKKYQNNFFIICLSSAISVLKQNNIKPDLYFSTDGGYWAGEHLKHLEKEVPLALPLEGYCPNHILKKIKVLPLTYKDGIADKITSFSDIEFMAAERNGTISGTALDFAKINTKEKIFFAGLDLAANKEFQHTQPNEIELNNQNKDFKLSSREKRLYPSSFESPSLNIYKEWFKNQNNNNNMIFRIINKNEKINSLGQIKDIDCYTFEEICKQIDCKCKTINYEILDCKLKPENKMEIYTFLKNNLYSKAFQEELFPLSQVSLFHNPENPQIKENLNKENTNLLSKIKRILNV